MNPNPRRFVAQVLWFEYASGHSSGKPNGYTYGWDVGVCPNYYCEVTTDAGGVAIE